MIEGSGSVSQMYGSGFRKKNIRIRIHNTDFYVVIPPSSLNFRVRVEAQDEEDDVRPGGDGGL